MRQALSLLVLLCLAGSNAWVPSTKRISGRQCMTTRLQSSSELSTGSFSAEGSAGATSERGSMPTPSREEQDELDLEDEMAREQYDALRCGEEMLSIEAFLNWEDIQDVLENGIIDGETLEIILEECNVGAQMSFSSFKEVVELVNSVQLQMEEGGGGEDMSWLPGGEGDVDGEGAEVDESAAMAMLAALGVKRKQN